MQSVVLRAAPDEAMNRALLLHARIEDVAEAEGNAPLAIAVTDEKVGDSAPVKYIDHHHIKVGSIDSSDALKQLLEPELHLR